jgi:hypothetical protein
MNGRMICGQSFVAIQYRGKKAATEILDWIEKQIQVQEIATSWEDHPNPKVRVVQEDPPKKKKEDKSEAKADPPAQDKKKTEKEEGEEKGKGNSGKGKGKGKGEWEEGKEIGIGEKEREVGMGVGTVAIQPRNNFRSKTILINHTPMHPRTRLNPIRVGEEKEARADGLSRTLILEEAEVIRERDPISQVRTPEMTRDAQDHQVRPRTRTPPRVPANLPPKGREAAVVLEEARSFLRVISWAL